MIEVVLVVGHLTALHLAHKAARLVQEAQLHDGLGELLLADQQADLGDGVPQGGLVVQELGNDPVLCGRDKDKTGLGRSSYPILLSDWWPA